MGGQYVGYGNNEKVLGSMPSWALIFSELLNVFFHLNEFTYTTGQELTINYLCLCLEVLQKQHECT